MKKLVFILIALVVLLTTASPANAHPGNTAADGCHYCRTNCDKWGVPWNERHCHNGGSAPINAAPVVQNDPAPTVYIPPTVVISTTTPIKLPTRIPTRIPSRVVTNKPTITPTMSLTSTPVITLTPTIAAKMAADEKIEKPQGFWANFMQFLFGK